MNNELHGLNIQLDIPPHVAGKTCLWL